MCRAGSDAGLKRAGGRTQDVQLLAGTLPTLFSHLHKLGAFRNQTDSIIRHWLVKGCLMSELSRSYNYLHLVVSTRVQLAVQKNSFSNRESVPSWLLWFCGYGTWLLFGLPARNGDSCRGRGWGWSWVCSRGSCWCGARVLYWGFGCFWDWWWGCNCRLSLLFI